MAITDDDVVNYQRMSPELVPYDKNIGLSNPAAVDMILSSSEYYDFHIAPRGQPYIRSAHLQYFSKMKKGHDAMFSNVIEPSEFEIYWLPLRLSSTGNLFNRRLSRQGRRVNDRRRQFVCGSPQYGVAHKLE